MNFNEAFSNKFLISEFCENFSKKISDDKIKKIKNSSDFVVVENFDDYNISINNIKGCFLYTFHLNNSDILFTVSFEDFFDFSSINYVSISNRNNVILYYCFVEKEYKKHIHLNENNSDLNLFLDFFSTTILKYKINHF